MAKPTPVNREIAFGIEELFFSRTDGRGVIASGNDVFVRVSGYARDQLVGAAHNVVRHPDMPKAVFRVLWQTILAGRPVSAYVKNLAGDGSYYWVFATVFPVEGGFLSIRLKPSTPLFKAIPGIYQKVLEKERKEGLEPSLQLLLEILKAEGFADYEKFMAAAILDEINARARTLESSKTEAASFGRGNTALEERLYPMAQRCGTVQRENAMVFAKLEHFAEMNKELAQKSGFILRSLQTLDLLSVNMSTAARRLGSRGVTLVAVANAIQKAAHDFKADLAKFNTTSTRVQGSIQNSQFKISTSQLQVDMIAFYVSESLAKCAEGALADDQVVDIKGNSQLLLGLSSASLREIVTAMGSLKDVLREITLDVQELSSTINGLEIIRKTGGIEAAQVPEGQAEFDTHFGAMRELVTQTAGQLNSFGDSIRQSLQDVDEIQPALFRISEGLTQLERLSEQLAPAPQSGA